MGFLDALDLALFALIGVGGFLMHRRIVKLEEARDARDQAEAKKAILKVSMEGQSPNQKIVIRNAEDASEARNVRLRLDGHPFNEHPACFPPGESYLPLAFLGPGGHALLNIALTGARSSPPYAAEVIWDDDYAADRSWRTVIT